ncbi:hypothetical protein [Nonomuraea sp. NPDC005650]|uniref:hypothetical protein n=1 Tax=Nonomuraea sp. NPDC005650 TaxID=3157045 RepID=UPI0033BD5C16
MLVFASASTMFAGCITPFSAYADTSSFQSLREARSLDITSGTGGGPDPSENDSVVSKTISVESPTNNQGYQHTSTSTPGGATSVQNALCRRAPVCKITQKVIVVAPGKVKEVAETATDAAMPDNEEDPGREGVETRTAERGMDAEPLLGERSISSVFKAALLSEMVEAVRGERPMASDPADTSNGAIRGCRSALPWRSSGKSGQCCSLAWDLGNQGRLSSADRAGTHVCTVKG